MAQCVKVIASGADGNQYLAVDEQCTQGLFIVNGAEMAAFYQNPLNIPMSEATPLALALMGLFVAAWSVKTLRRALD